MAVYSITARSPKPELGLRIAREFSDSFAWSDSCWFVYSTESAQAIARKMGVSEPDPQGKSVSEFGHLLVAKITTNYWGYGPTSAWDWFKATFERGD